MTAESREELISAYLDGELADDERARVEKLLAEDSSLQQLHDELAALRGGLQALERHKLDHDLSAAVLRRAEQTVLRGDAAKVAPATSGGGEPPGSWWKRGAGWRRVVWPAVAVAAALAILVYDANQRSPERPVAQAPERQPEPAGAAGNGPFDDDGDAAAGESVALPRGGAAYAAPANEAPAPEASRMKTESLDRIDSANGVRSRAARGAGRMAEEGASPAMGGGMTVSPTVRAKPSVAAASEDLSADALNKNSVIVKVTPRYLQEATFEKLLDAKQIKWRRLADAPRDDANSGYFKRDSERKAAESGLKPGSVRAYLVEADPEQVDALLAGLERAGNLAADRDQPDVVNQSLTEKKRGRVVILVAPTAPAAAAPAEPAASPP